MIDLAELDMELETETKKPGSATPAASVDIAISHVSAPQTRARGKFGVLYFDIETIPDYDRAELFELEDIPPAAKRGDFDKCPLAFDLLKQTLDKIKEDLRLFTPVDKYLDELDRLEKLEKKPRKGVFDATNELRNQDAARGQLIADQKKKMSVTPEMNRIVALGWSLNGDTRSLVDGDLEELNDPCEKDLLEKFWFLAKTAKSLCGFNILGFDLPTIYTRSILLDVAPSRQWDLKPWGTDVIDLMKKRFPSNQAIGLKKLAKLLGIPIPAGDVDGSQVEELWQKDPAKVGEYVRSDVDLVIELHQRYSGFFC